MSIPAETQRHRFTVAAYFRMAETGILDEDERVELLDGDVIQLSQPGYRHAAVVDRLNALFAPLARESCIVRVQNPVVLDEFSAPQPDIALLRYTKDFYGYAHPQASDMLLAVEVADTTVGKDLLWKARLYAAAGIPEYWVLDLNGDRVVVHTQPSASSFLSVREFARGAAVSTAVFPNRLWKVEDLLGP
jgi:Uma2 family endonuclease